MKKINTTIILLLFVSTMSILMSVERPEPWMVIPDQKVVSPDFTKSGAIDPAIGKPLWGAKWEVVDGMLRGSPSSPEEQAGKTSHNGADPRLILSATPAEYFAQFSIRFIGGEKSGSEVLPLIDLGHHVCALILGNDKGLTLTIDRKSQLIAQDESFTFEKNKNYYISIEVKGPEVLIRIADGSLSYTLYALNNFLEGKKRTLGLAGAIHSIIEIDEMAIWTIKDGFQSNWSERRDTLPKIIPIQLKEPPKKKPK